MVTMMRFQGKVSVVLVLYYLYSIVIPDTTAATSLPADPTKFPNSIPSPSSSSAASFPDDRNRSTADPSGSKIPRLGLNVAGTIKCLLWRTTNGASGTQQQESLLTPLFSPAPTTKTTTMMTTTSSSSTTTTTNDNNVDGGDCEVEAIQSGVQPAEVYVTADYRFQKDRWYGLRRVGMLFRWQLPGRDKHRLCPTTFDATVERSLPWTIPSTKIWRSLSSSKSTSSSSSSSSSSWSSLTPIDGASIRLGWEEEDDDEDLSYGHSNNNNVLYGPSSSRPWIRISVDGSSTDDDSSFSSKSDDPKLFPHTTSLGIFLPLRRRFDVMWMSSLKSMEGPTIPKKQQQHVHGETSNKGVRLQNPDDWWIPQVSVDPLGMISSHNSYRNRYGRNGRYLVEFKLRVSTKVSLWSTPGLGWGDDDDDDGNVPAGLIRLDCSVHDGQNYLPSQQGHGSYGKVGKSTTTVRLETVVLLSQWWNSLKETTRLSLIHERNEQWGGLFGRR